MEYVTRGVCGQEGCRERRYYLDNGLWFCRRGHLQEVWPVLAPIPAWRRVTNRGHLERFVHEKLKSRAGSTSRRRSGRFRNSGSETQGEEGEGGEVTTEYVNLPRDCWLQRLIPVVIAYRGRQAATLFLQAYQLILWKQCYALVHEHGFPEQFEVSLRHGSALSIGKASGREKLTDSTGRCS